jgi:predicted aspartyl protease
MITGTVNSNREAAIRLSIRGSDEREQEIEAVIDTGFNGFITLPPAVVAALDLPYLGRGRAILANGDGHLGWPGAFCGGRSRRHGRARWHVIALWA